MDQRIRNLGIVILFFLTASLFALPLIAEAAALPAPTHPIMFGYYKVESNYGFYIDEVKDYTDTELLGSFDFFRPAPNYLNDQAGFDRAFSETIAAGHTIVYGPDPGTLDLALDKAKPYWDKITWIYLADEPNWDKATIESEITAFKNKVSQKGLAQKPIAINFTQQQILTKDGYQASNLDIVGTEAYIDPAKQNDSNLVSQLNNQIDQLKQKIGNRKMFLVMQAYDRNGAWTNINSLVSIQTPVYLKSYNDKNVIGIFMFSYARKGGTRDHPELKVEHQNIAQALGFSVSPSQPPPTSPGPIAPLDVLPGWLGGLAYNFDKNEWLVVSQPPHVGTIWGALVGDGGTIIKPQFAVSSANMLGTQPRAVYSPDLKQYLVIFNQAWGSPASPVNPGAVYGQFVSDTGKLVGNPFNLTAGIVGALPVGNLRYDSKNKQFVFSFEESKTDTVRLAAADLSGKAKFKVVVSSSAPFQGAGVMAVNGNNSEYCVAYKKTNGTSADGDIAVRRVDAVNGTVGAETVLTQTTANQSGHPGIDFDPATNTYLAVWNASGKLTMGRLMSGCGTAKGSEFQIKQNLSVARVDFNPKSKLFGIIGEMTVTASNKSGSGEQNFTMFVTTSGKIYDGTPVFADVGDIGNKVPSIAANTQNGTFAAISSKDYGRTRFVSGLFYDLSSGPPPDLVCDPLPVDDPVKLAECNFWMGIDPGGSGGGGAGTIPIDLGFSGAAGISAAYNSKDDTIFIAHADTTRVRGVLVAAKDFSVKTPDQQIDTGKNPLTATNPTVVYNDKDNKFFAIWQDERPKAGTFHIWARPIAGDGNPLTSDASIVDGARATLAGLTYDSIRNIYPLSYVLNNQAYLSTVSAGGNPGSSLSLGNGGSSFSAGKTCVAFNPDDDQYWVSFAANSSTAGSKVMFAKVDAKAFKAIGTTVQLSSSAAVAKNSCIAYSGSDKAAVVVWEENSGVYGIRVSASSIGSQFPIVTPGLLPYSGSYSKPYLVYNPWTQTFFTASLDDFGGIISTEFDSYGNVFSNTQPLPPSSGIASQALLANPSGALVLGSVGGSAKIVLAKSLFALSAGGGGGGSGGGSGGVRGGSGSAPPPVDTSTLPKLISQIYVWALGISAILAVLMVVLGGYLVMTAQGNAQQATKGKDFIISAIIGLVLLFGSYILLSTINPDLVNLDISSLNGLNQP